MSVLVCSCMDYVNNFDFSFGIVVLFSFYSFSYSSPSYRWKSPKILLPTLLHILPYFFQSVIVFFLQLLRPLWLTNLKLMKKKQLWLQIYWLWRHLLQQRKFKVKLFMVFFWIPCVSALSWSSKAATEYRVIVFCYWLLMIKKYLWNTSQRMLLTEIFVHNWHLHYLWFYESDTNMRRSLFSSQGMIRCPNCYGSYI